MRHCLLPQAQSHQKVVEDLQHHVSYSLMRPKLSVLPVTSTITYAFRDLGSCYSSYRSPCKLVQIPTSPLTRSENIWGSHKHLLCGNRSMWTVLEPSSASPVPHSSRIFCCPCSSCKQHRGITADLQAIDH